MCAMARFTAANAREMAARSVAARKAAEVELSANPTPAGSLACGVRAASQS